MERTYTYTAADYREVFGGRRDGKVGVDPDGDLVWVSTHDQIVWAKEAVVLDMVKLSTMYTSNDIVYQPSGLQKDAFDARQ